MSKLRIIKSDRGSYDEYIGADDNDRGNPEEQGVIIEDLEKRSKKWIEYELFLNTYTLSPEDLINLSLNKIIRINK